MSKKDDEQYLDFLRYQEVTVDNTVQKKDRTLSRQDHKFMAKAAKAQAKEDRKRGRN